MQSQNIDRQICSLAHQIRRMIDTRIGFSDEKMTGLNNVVLNFIGRKTLERKEVYPGDVSKEFGLTRSGTSKMLSRLEENGYIELRADENDARKKQIFLTESAKKYRKRFQETASYIEKNMHASFTEEEMNQLKEYLDRLQMNLESLYRKENDK